MLSSGPPGDRPKLTPHKGCIANVGANGMKVKQTYEGYNKAYELGGPGNLYCSRGVVWCVVDIRGICITAPTTKLLYSCSSWLAWLRSTLLMACLAEKYPPHGLLG